MMAAMTPRADQSETVRGPGLIGRALAPLWRMCLWVQSFAARAASLRRIRRTHRCAATWRESWPGLRRCEWLMRQIIGEGARRLLAGEDIGLDTIPVFPDPPEDFEPACPRDPWEMNRRMIALANFHADPPGAIRRHAARLARAIAGAARVAPPIQAVCVCVPAPRVPLIANSRAPPGRASAHRRSFTPRSLACGVAPACAFAITSRRS